MLPEELTDEELLELDQESIAGEAAREEEAAGERREGELPRSPQGGAQQKRLQTLVGSFGR